ncbi:MAG: hypothetical protein GXY54_03060 [Deltaproteobacteria bacterium]|nr:hypothetical protein [Deltaproteobacteria bacterium]
MLSELPGISSCFKDGKSLTTPGCRAAPVAVTHLSGDIPFQAIQVIVDLVPIPGIETAIPFHAIDSSKNLVQLPLEPFSFTPCDPSPPASHVDAIVRLADSAANVPVPISMPLPMVGVGAMSRGAPLGIAGCCRGEKHKDGNYSEHHLFHGQPPFLVPVVWGKKMESGLPFMDSLENIKDDG